MATDSKQEAMEDILSSIRTTLAEETAKVGTGSGDLIDAAAAQDGAEAGQDAGDVLELTPAEMVGGGEAAKADAPKAEGDELIDIATFAATGEAKPADPAVAAAAAEELKAQPTAGAAPETQAASDEFDRLLAEISQEQVKQEAAVEDTKKALLAEEGPLGGEAEADGPAVVEVPAAAAAPDAPAVNGNGYAVSAVNGPNGMQVAFPAEILAMALRPMVQEWLQSNLPGIVERLVKDEISKLAQG